MPADLSRLPSGQAGWLALVEHALLLGDLAEVDYLELKGGLPFAQAADRKRSAVVLARAVLGLSNRMPDTAAKHLGGHGVVLVGVRGNEVIGAEYIDGAVLHDALVRYLGDDGPRWDYVFVRHPAGLVLAIVVDPPAWGDPMHACRKEYAVDDRSASVRDGDVFVRVPGKTRPATSSDLADLQRRRDRSPRAAARVAVGYDGGFDRVDTASVIALIETTIDDVADSLLADVPSRLPVYPYGGALPALLDQGTERRSPERFAREVEHWRDRSRALAAGVADDFLRHELAPGRWTLGNESDRYLESVRAQIDLPPGVKVLMASDTDYCDHGGPFRFMSVLPDPPARWGTASPFAVSAVMAPRLSAARPLAAAFDLQQTPDGVRVTWHAGDLRPRSTERGDEPFAVVTDDHVSKIGVRWRVTARGVDDVLEGTTTIACATGPGAHLRWERTPGSGQD